MRISKVSILRICVCGYSVCYLLSCGGRTRGVNEWFLAPEKEHWAQFEQIISNQSDVSLRAAGSTYSINAERGNMLAVRLYEVCGEGEINKDIADTLTDCLKTYIESNYPVNLRLRLHDSIHYVPGTAIDGRCSFAFVFTISRDKEDVGNISISLSAANYRGLGEMPVIGILNIIVDQP